MEHLQPLLQELGFPPFGRVASNRDANKACWLTHLIAVTEAPNGLRFRAGIKPAFSDRLFSRALRLASGRNVFLFTPTRWQFRLQLACNSVSGGDFAADWKVILKSLAGHRLFDKHILFQEGPTLLSNGEIEFCDNCPDAVWQDDALVPVCLTDRMAPAKPKNTP